MELAALATRAVPGLSPTGVADAPDDARDFMSAVVVDDSGNRWRVRGPQHQQAAMRLETEVQVLRGFSTAIRAELPFRVPSVAGATRVEEMRVFVYNHLPGEPVALSELVGASPELIEDLGRTIAAVHDLTESVVDHADLPAYSAERVRQRRLNELDAAAATGQIPPLLLRRWERAMEDRALWKFAPTVVHGDLHEDNLLIEGDRVMAVTGWTDLHVGDPADDLAWLIASPDHTFSDRVLSAYTAHRHAVPDEHVLRRAALSAEFALAQWMIRGTTSGNTQMIEEAAGLLRQLATDIETYGGRPIALDSPADGPSPAPADQQDSKPVRRAGAAATVAGAGSFSPDEDDDEPAYVTDADVANAAADADQQSPAPAAFAADPLTEELPAYVDDAGEFDLPAPATGSLPIQPDDASERRAKQKNFFPSSAASAASARSASSSASSSSAASAASAPSASSADSGGAAESHGADDSAGSAPSPASAASLYDRHPGLRPPGS